MLESEKISLVQSLSGETEVGTVAAYLSLAGDKVCRRAFPFDPTATQVPDEYAMTQVELAVHLLNRRGNEGLLSHSENGYSDTFESGYAYLLRGVVPLCGTFGGADDGADS